VANFHDSGSRKQISQADPQEILTAIRSFLSTCRAPAVLEKGEEVAALRPGEFELDVRAGRVCIEFLCGSRTVSRRIIEVERHATGVLECAIQRFAGKPGKLSFLDLRRPQTASRMLRATRESFAEQFRRMLYRQFPGWGIEALTCGMDLQHSLSPAYPRAYLKRGVHGIAAMACPRLGDEAAALSFALIWHDYVCSMKQSSTLVQLCLFLPEKGGLLTAQRLRWLTGRRLTVRLFRFNEHGSAGEVDPEDVGNLDTRVAPGCADAIPGNGKSNFAKFRFGRPNHSPGPEQLLEGFLRREIQTIDPLLRPEPIYGQLLTFAGMDRDMIDLLAVSEQGRLTILELKVTEDVHLPLQALDYWMRIAWHARQSELNHLFAGIPLDAKPPRLLLVAPAMCFHSTNATVLSYFSGGIEVERIGINEGWRQAIQVVFRLSGPDLPISHRSLE
jgi:hypothetical protein